MAALPSTPRRRINWRNVWLYLILIVTFLIIAFPIYWMLTISLKIPRDIYRTPSLWPHNVTGDNYREQKMRISPEPKLA